MSEHTTVMTRKGQITVPAPIRRALGLKEGDRITFVMDRDQVRLVALGSVVARTAGALRQYRREPAPTAEELRAAAEEAIAQEVAEQMGGADGR